MKEKNKTAIIVAIIGAISSISTAMIGNNHGIERQNILAKTGVNIDINDSNNTVIINNVDDLVNEYNNLALKNKELDRENTKYANELADMTERLNVLQTQIEQQNSNHEINRIIQEATEYWNDSDYVQCLTLLKNSKSKSTDVEVLYEKYSDEYVINLLSQSELLIEQREYNEAINVLKEGKAIVFNDKMLDEKIIEINNKQPVKLSNLKLSASRFFNLCQSPVEDTIGNRYSTGNLFITYAEGKSDYGYGTFYLGKKYSSLSGSIAVSDESENRSDVQLEGWIEIVKISNEEYTTVWTSPMLSRMISTVDIPEVDLTDSEWLEIRYYNNGEYFSLAAGYHSLRVLISDIAIYIE